MNIFIAFPFIIQNP